MNLFKAGKRLMQFIAISSTITSLMILFSIISLHKVNKNIVSIYANRVIPLKQLKVISDAYAISIVDCSHKTRMGNISWPQAIKSIELAQRQIEYNWNAYMQTYLTKEEREVAGMTLLLIDSANVANSHLLSILEKGKNDSNNAELEKFIQNELYQKIDPLTNKINELINIQITEAKNLGRESESLNIKIIVLSVLIALILLFNIYLFLDKVRLAKILQDRSIELEMANEELNTTIEELHATNDELHRINEELIELKINLENIVESRTKEYRELSYMFEQTMENTADGIWFMEITDDQKFKFMRFNPVIENSLNLRNADLGKEGKLVEELFNDELSAYFNERYLTCLTTSQPYNYEENIVLNQEDTFWNTTLVPIKNEAGDIIKIVGFTRNLTHEKLMEKSLLLSEQKYRFLFEKMNNALAIYEPVFDGKGNVIDFRYIEMNPAFDIHSSFPASECLGKTFSSIHGDNIHSLKNYIATYETGEAEHFEAYQIKFDKYFNINVFKPTDNRIAVIFDDITVSRKAKLELARTSKYLQTLIDASPLAIYDLNKNGEVNSIWNTTAEKIFGWTKAEVLGKPLPFLTKETKKEFLQLSKKVYDGEVITNIELKRKRKNGDELFISLGSAPIVDPYNQEGKIIAFVSDITEKKALELIHLESESKFRKLFENSTDGIAIHDLFLKPIEVNITLLNLIGHTREEYMNTPLLNFFPPKYHQILKHRQAEHKSGKILPSLEAEAKHISGSLVPIEITSRLIELNNQTLVMTIVRDLTMQKYLQKKLLDTMIEAEENERRKLARDLHDDIGPQLATMRIYTTSLQRRVLEPDTKGILEILLDVINHSIENIREISYNLSPGVLERYGLATALEKECELLRLFLTVNFVHNIKNLRFKNKTEIVIYRIVRELLNNTKKYARASEVEVKVNFIENSLLLVYQDNGSGFEYDKIMNSEGRGLGLSNIEMRSKSLEGEYYFGNTISGGMRFSLQCKAEKIDQ